LRDAWRAALRVHLLQVELPKDDKKGLEDDIQKLTDTYVKKLEDMAKAKTDEVMKV
jgi:ribosome recycling factor